MSQEFKGEYTRVATGLKYTYLAQAQVVSGAITCDAKVYRDGELKGRVTTVIHGASAPEAAGPLIRMWITDSIDRLIGIRA